MKGAGAFELARREAEATRRGTAPKPPEEPPEVRAPGSVEHMMAMNGAAG
jgi:hypothetical protein